MKNSLELSAIFSKSILLTAIPGLGLVVWAIGPLSVKTYVIILVSGCCSGLANLLEFSRFSNAANPAWRILQLPLYFAWALFLAFALPDQRIGWNFFLQLALVIAISSAAIEILFRKKARLFRSTL